VPHTIIIDNGRQFINKELAKLYTSLGIKHITSLVENPQTNGQAELANKVILVELRKRLDGEKRKWPKELFEVLWAYRCTLQSATNESPFSLVYGTEVMSAYFCPHSVFNFGYLIELMWLKSDLIDNSNN